MRPYYEEAGIVIWHGDCREILPTLGPVDLVLTDPPYGIGIADNPVRQKHARMDWDSAPVSGDLLAVLRFLSRYQIVWGGNYFDVPSAQCFLIWDKVQPEDFSLAMCEQAWTNLQKPAKLFRRRVVGYVKEHPTEKPVELLAWCISQAPEDCTLILDPFMGSGTTLVAAKQLGRRAIGIEIEERYCEIAVKRLAQSVMDFSPPEPVAEQLMFEATE
jgi:site-specific DNA-methyltransferase (adenine-specific)